MQLLVLYAALLGMLLVAASFVHAIRNSSEREDDYDAVTSKAYGIRRWWMVFVCAFGLALTVATLTPFPLTASTGTAPRIVQAQSGQWYWNLEDKTAIVGESIQYHVSTVDVNHGFAVFDPNNKLIAQTQAMPGYVNKLNITFTEPGKHLVRCLEYCGLAHHSMIVEIDVSEAN